MQIIEEQKSANTDQLTGLYNRRAYEMDIEDFSKAPLPGNLTYISMDLNGLKTANDNLGHDAGDRLIKGAADCMLQCFNKYGKVYRIGGDEFAAIIFTENDLQELINEFRLLCEKWSNDNKLKLAVSCGHVISKDYAGQNLHELSKLADTAMYRDKDDYYRENGLDRRKS